MRRCATSRRVATRRGRRAEAQPPSAGRRISMASIMVVLATGISRGRRRSWHRPARQGGELSRHHRGPARGRQDGWRSSAPAASASMSASSGMPANEQSRSALQPPNGASTSNYANRGGIELRFARRRGRVVLLQRSRRPFCSTGQTTGWIRRTLLTARVQMIGGVTTMHDASGRTSPSMASRKLAVDNRRLRRAESAPEPKVPGQAAGIPGRWIGGAKWRPDPGCQARHRPGHASRRQPVR